MLLGIPGDNTYCWDARPFPAFPQQTDIWGDGGNWAYGHWLNGRLASAPLAELAAVILNEYGFNDFETAGLNGIVPGYVIDRIMSARDALQPLELAYFFDSLESGGKIKLRHRGLEPPVKTVTVDGMVEARAGTDLVTLTRAQETDLPASAKLRFISGADDYRQAVAEARRLAGASGRVSQADLAIVLDDGLASGIVDTWLFETWAARERAQFALPPSALAIEPGDILTFDQATRSRFLRVTEVSEHGTRDIKALAVDPDLYGRSSSPDRTPRTKPPVQTGSPARGISRSAAAQGNGGGGRRLCRGRTAAVARRGRRLFLGAIDGLCLEEHLAGAGDARADARSAVNSVPRGGSIGPRACG